MEAIRERLTTPVLGEYDVIVCGGGIGGVSAAAAAARNGASVLLIEKGVQLGGLSTSGLISWYEPLCDGLGNRLMGGIAEELLRLAIRFGSDTLDPAWQNGALHADCEKRCATFFSPSMFTMALDSLVIDAGVKVLFDTTVVRPVMEKSFCKGIVVENKSGRGFYSTKVVIDATGDADVLSRAGVPCVNGKNYLTYIGYVLDESSLTKAIESKNLLDARRWTAVGADLWGNGQPDGIPEMDGITAEAVTQFVLAGRRLFFEQVCRRERDQRDVVALPGMAQLRTTRRITGAYELTEADKGMRFYDSVGVAGDFANRGKRYELPLRTLYHPDYPNLLTAGRTISSSGWAWEVTRVIPVSAATGQAAGTLAALCARQDTPVARFDVALLQKQLRSAGVSIHLDETGGT